MDKARFDRIVFGVVFGLISISVGNAAPVTPSLIATPPQAAWNELTVQQKIILAPLCDTWDSMAHERRKRWIGISRRFLSRPPEEQRRIQAQMSAWDKLTIEQRKEARNNFKTARQLSHEKKQALKQKWSEYLNLSKEQKLEFLKAGSPSHAPQSPDPGPVLPEQTP